MTLSVSDGVANRQRWTFESYVHGAHCTGEFQ